MPRLRIARERTRPRAHRQAPARQPCPCLVHGLTRTVHIYAFNVPIHTSEPLHSLALAAFCLALEHCPEAQAVRGGAWHSAPACSHQLTSIRVAQPCWPALLGVRPVQRAASQSQPGARTSAVSLHRPVSRPQAHEQRVRQLPGVGRPGQGVARPLLPINRNAYRGGAFAACAPHVVCAPETGRWQCLTPSLPPRRGVRRMRRARCGALQRLPGVRVPLGLPASRGRGEPAAQSCVGWICAQAPQGPSSRERQPPVGRGPWRPSTACSIGSAGAGQATTRPAAPRRPACRCLESWAPAQGP